ncbi:hypothetical protein [Streptomyces pimonensis]|uniref:hypothetical protein n=1 Tax=Streptomyces pimonensis TaxID=2860288 RepID=UPI003529B0C0
MLPKVDFPELLLEVAEPTGTADAFMHISGPDSGMEGFATSLCGRRSTRVLTRFPYSRRALRWVGTA